MEFQARRLLSLSEATVHPWHSKYRDIDLGSLCRLRELETENGRLKK